MNTLSISTLIMGGIVLAYIGYAAYKQLSVVYRRIRAISNNTVIEIDGTVSSKTDEIRKAVNKQMVELCYPVYSSVIDGREISCTGDIKRPDVNLWSSAVLCHDSITGETWVKEDTVLLKRYVLTRAGLVVGLVLLMFALTVRF